MSTIANFLAIWWRPLLFFAWFQELSELLINDRYTAFLRPEFGYVLGIGTFIVGGFLLVGVGEMRSRQFNPRQVLTALILLLPLFYLHNARGVSLDSYAFEKRSLGFASLTPNGEFETNDQTSLNPLQNPRRNRQCRVKAQKVNILDLGDAPSVYQGKRVKLVGMLHQSDAWVKKEFGDDTRVVFRFIVTCCVADAYPGLVLVQGNDLPKFSEGTWVEVEGTFRVLKKDGHRAMLMEESTIKRTQEPGQPYLF
ncbi:MAG: TIGR03943 family protein [Deltaproteobacteria bacterium]|nr:TIGR03943 family protein [Deltaproteobacteria bacterium]